MACVDPSHLPSAVDKQSKVYRKSHIPNFRGLAKTIAVTASKQLVDDVGEYADYACEAFRTRIRAQGFTSFRVILYPESGTNLSPEWLDRKEAAGADLRTMIATEHYVRNIRVFRSLAKNKRSGTFRIGFPEGEQARDLNGERVPITLERVAAIQENGTSRIPARPHWGPQLRRMQRELPAVRRAMRERVARAIQTAVAGRMARGG